MSIKSPFKDTISTSFLSPFVEEDLDVDAFRYIRSVEAADGQSLEIGVRRAISDFVSGCKSDGIWDAIKASCILAGARTLNGALVPLAGTAPTNYNFVSGDYDRKTGLVGDGSTKYLDSNRNNNADPQDNRHVSAFVRETTTLTGQPIFGTGGGFLSGGTYLHFGAGAAANRMIASASNSGFGPGIATGLLGLSRESSSSVSSINSGNVSLLSSASASPVASNINIFSGYGSVVVAYSDSRIAFYSIGESLDLALLDARVTDLITAFGAAIP